MGLSTAAVPVPLEEEEEEEEDHYMDRTVPSDYKDKGSVHRHPVGEDN